MYTLIELPYSNDDLMPVITAKTLEFHHGKHLQGYVNNLNNLLKGSELENATLEDVVKKSSGAVFNNAGQILNHNLYFLELKKAADNNAPSGKILDLINRDFGSFEAFKDEFFQEGRGSVWLGMGMAVAESRWQTRNLAGVQRAESRYPWQHSASHNRRLGARLLP